MTAEEIKSKYSMRDIVERYGFRINRGSFIRCPFHQGDRTASLKVYKDSFHCYGCGANGDIFTFVQMMDNVSFRDAFISLGGTYQKAQTKNERRHIQRELILAERRRQKEKEEFEEKRQQMHELSKEMDLYLAASRILEPLSDLWCYAVENLEITYGKWFELWEEVSKGL